MKSRSQQISDKQAIKEFLMTEIGKWSLENNLSPTEAAKLLGITKQQFSAVIGKNVDQFTVDALVSLLERVGKHIQFSVE